MSTTPFIDLLKGVVDAPLTAMMMADAEMHFRNKYGEPPTRGRPADDIVLSGCVLVVSFDRIRDYPEPPSECSELARNFVGELVHAADDGSAMTDERKLTRATRDKLIACVDARRWIKAAELVFDLSQSDRFVCKFTGVESVYKIREAMRNNKHRRSDIIACVVRELAVAWNDVCGAVQKSCGTPRNYLRIVYTCGEESDRGPATTSPHIVRQPVRGLPLTPARRMARDRRKSPGVIVTSRRRRRPVEHEDGGDNEGLGGSPETSDQR